MFLATTALEWCKRHTRGANQQANSPRAAELVGREGQQINPESLEGEATLGH